MQIKTASAALLVAAVTLVGCDDKDRVSLDTQTFNPKALQFAYPLNEQSQVAPDTIIALSFNGQVSAETSNFLLSDSNGEPVDFELTFVNDGKGVVLSPVGSLQTNHQYHLTLNGVSVDGEPAALRGGVLSFTTRAALEGAVSTRVTADAFEVESMFPDDEQFKTMDFSSFRLRTTHPIDRASAEYGETVSLTRDGELVDALLLVSGSAITVDPLEDMEPGVSYELVVDGLVSRFGDAIAPFSHTAVPLDTTSPTTGERPVLVTEAPPTDPDLGCLEEGGRISPLTGLPINCVPIVGTILQDKTASKQSGIVFGELAHAPNFPDVTPLRVKRGGLLTGDALAILVGGEVPVGFDSGQVLVEIISDASGYLFPSPQSDAENAPKNLRLFMDVATTTMDARANGAFTQNLMHLELVGKGEIVDGVLEVDAITVVEPRVLGVENNFGMLSFRMESFLDQEAAPQPRIDAENPFVPVMDGPDGPELSWQPGNVADRMVPGEPIIIHFNEALDPLTIEADLSLFLDKDGMPEPFSWRLDGNAIVISPDSPIAFGSTYAVTTTPDITDLAGNPLAMLNSLDGSNTLSFTMAEAATEDADMNDVRRSPFAMVTYPGFPCASSEATDDDKARGFQGVCLSSSPEEEQVEVDELPIVELPANRPIRVRFSQDMDADTIQNGVQVIREDDGSIVEGVIETQSRAFTFIPQQPWEEGTLYRYILPSNGGGEGCLNGAICSVDGLPLQTALLLGAPMREGGPNMEIIFRGAAPVKTVFQELNNLSSGDVNNNFQIDQAEQDGDLVVGEGFDFATEGRIPPNSTIIMPRNGGGEGVVAGANTGCGYEDVASLTPEECDHLRILYIAGALNVEIVDFDPEQGGVPVLIYPTAVALTNLDATAVIGLRLTADEEQGGLLGIIPVLGDLLQETVDALLDATGLDELIEATGLDNIGLAPVPTATGPNIMRVRYNLDENGERTQVVPGVILPPENEGEPPIFRITFDLLFDAPALSLPLGLEHNVKSLPIPNVQLEGPVEFLPDGRLFIGLQNLEPLNVDLEITLAGFDGGKVTLVIPEGGINLSYQSVSIQK